MSYWKQIEITDVFSNIDMLTAFNELLVVEPVRLVGGIFNGSTLDTNFWTVTNVGSGTTTVSSGQRTTSTGTTANSSSKVVSSQIARHIGTTVNRYRSRVAMGDTGTTNNVRRWGAFNGTDGAYYKISGTSLYVCTMISGTETAVISTSWNGNQTVPTLTNSNSWEIYYTTELVVFIVNGVIAHTITALTSPWSSIWHFPTFADNMNSGGSTTNVSMICRSTTIYRLGKSETQPVYGLITTAGTYVLKYGPGQLHRITFGNSGGTNLTVYDNTAGSGTVICSMNTPAQAQPLTLEFGIGFNNGLTVVSTGTWSACVIYE
jgi:hypothetical protein